VTNRSGSSAGGAVALERRAILWGALGFGIGAFASLLFFHDGTVPLAGRRSLGIIASASGGLYAIAAFVVSYRRSVRGPAFAWRTSVPPVRRALHVVGLAFLHLAVCLLACLVGFFVLQNAFRGLELDIAPAALLSAIVVALCGYLTYLGAANITSFTLAAVLTVFVAGGGLVSTITAEDPRWWEHNFSALGMGDAFSSWAFNLTVIIAGLVIATLADYITADLHAWVRRRGSTGTGHVGVLTGALITLGLLFVVVGAVPADRSLLVHNTAASGMVFVFLAISVGIRWALPGFSSAFFAVSQVAVVAVLVTIVLFFPIGYLNLTAAELVLAALVFAWLIIFVRHVGAALEDDARSRSESPDGG
jgi:hypothetical protein